MAEMDLDEYFNIACYLIQIIIVVKFDHEESNEQMNYFAKDCVTVEVRDSSENIVAVHSGTDPKNVDQCLFEYIKVCLRPDATKTTNKISEIWIIATQYIDVPALLSQIRTAFLQAQLHLLEVIHSNSKNNRPSISTNAAQVDLDAIDLKRLIKDDIVKLRMLTSNTDKVNNSLLENCKYSFYMNTSFSTVEKNQKFFELHDFVEIFMQLFQRVETSLHGNADNEAASDNLQFLITLIQDLIKFHGKIIQNDVTNKKSIDALVKRHADEIVKFLTSVEDNRTQSIKFRALQGPIFKKKDDCPILITIFEKYLTTFTRDQDICKHIFETNANPKLETFCKKFEDGLLDSLIFVDYDNVNFFESIQASNLPVKSFVWAFIRFDKHLSINNLNQMDALRNQGVQVLLSRSFSKEDQAVDHIINTMVTKIDGKVPPSVVFFLISKDTGFRSMSQNFVHSKRHVVWVNPEMSQSKQQDETDKNRREKSDTPAFSGEMSQSKKRKKNGKNLREKSDTPAFCGEMSQSKQQNETDKNIREKSDKSLFNREMFEKALEQSIKNFCPLFGFDTK